MDLSLERVIALTEQAVEDGIAPSFALAIGERGTTLLKQVWGNASITPHVIPADEDTAYDLASMSKVFSTTMIALRFIEEGTLALTDTVGMFFPSNPVKSEITIQQLLTHTSGLPAHFFLEKAVRSPYDATQAILDVPLISAPGEEVTYSCMGYILLGKILEEIGRMPLDLLAQKYVFTPLEMFSTAYLPLQNTRLVRADSFACTEIVGKEPLRGIVHDENARFLDGVAGNAGVFSTIGDCARFAQMLAQDGEGFLSSATVRLLYRNFTPDMAEHRSLGMMLASTPNCFAGDLFPPNAFGHTGFTGTSLLIDPTSGLWVVMLTNRVHPRRTNTRLFRFRKLLHNAIMAEYLHGINRG